MDSQTPDILEQTLAGLNMGLRVKHIATYYPSTCDADDLGRSILAQARKYDI